MLGAWCSLAGKVGLDCLSMVKPLWVERTQPVNPSKLGIFLVCPLRYVFETERLNSKKIGDHPSALLGTAVHNAAELLRRRFPTEPSASIAVLEQCIDHLLASASPSTQLIAWTLSLYGKNALLPRAQLISYAGFAWSLAQRLPPRRIDGTGEPRRKTGHIPVGLERWLASAHLDIAGRADEIYWVEHRHIRIVDFKTGGIRDNVGSPKQNYVLQLSAYGLAVRELDPSVEITLELLGKADQWIGSFDASKALAALQLLSDLRTALPRGKAISATHLSCVGEHCGQCTYRPSCLSYREHLLREIVIDHGFYGFDVCGTLTGIAEENGFQVMRILLSQGFTARISRIPVILLQTDKCVAGFQAIAFGIRSLEPARAGSTPQNFYVVDVQHPRNTAFQACFHLEPQIMPI